ncbi:MAG: hypothetical protein KQH59_20540 [Desulfobulbaceae bacterium]|nr:hypothetical protein [Desulfobulbaceae bacterium]
MKQLQKYLRENKSILFAYRIDRYQHAKRKKRVYFPFDIAFYLVEDKDYYLNKMKTTKDIRSMPRAETMWLYCLNTSPLRFQYEVVCKAKVLREDKRHRIPFEEDVFRRWVATKSFYSYQSDHLDL